MTLPATVSKIIDWIKNNKQLALIGLALFLFLIAIISALIPEKKGPGVALIEQPLFFYQNRRIVLEENSYDQVNYPRRGLDIYKIKENNQNIKVEGIITLLNITAPQKGVFANNILYEWKNKSNDIVQYDVKSQELTIVLQNRKDIFPDLVSPSDSQLKELLPNFVNKYVNNNYKYYDINIRKEGFDTVIEGRRKIGDYPLQRPGFDKYSDYIQLDEKFNLKNVRISMVEFEEKAYDKLKLIKPDEINSVASNSSYPRELNQGFPEGVNAGQPAKLPVNGDNLGIEIPKVTNMRMNTVEIVYLFSNSDQKFLTPVYRMTGSGSIVIEGQSYNVQTQANVSAIDPDYVFVPSNITYTQ